MKRTTASTSNQCPPLLPLHLSVGDKHWSNFYLKGPTYSSLYSQHHRLFHLNKEPISALYNDFELIHDVYIFFFLGVMHNVSMNNIYAFIFLRKLWISELLDQMVKSIFTHCKIIKLFSKEAVSCLRSNQQYLRFNF